MAEEHEYQGFIEDVFYQVRKMAANARTRRITSAVADGFDAGCEAELLNVLRLMQLQAVAHGIDAYSHGIHQFDPIGDQLEPPERK
ncbi:MAG: hypothetical protein WKG01_04395 [Kofleriaceae bacterium]